MTPYLETSAVLRWLFAEQDADVVISAIEKSKNVVSSALTVCETQRAIVRAEAQGLIKPAEAQRLAGMLISAQMQWHILSIAASVLERAGGRFPTEPLRTLDAIHLASALELLQAFPDMRVLSFDDRIVSNLEPLGIPGM
jgi:predicted nucleic acid-binding protein